MPAAGPVLTTGSVTQSLNLGPLISYPFASPPHLSHTHNHILAGQAHTALVLGSNAVATLTSVTACHAHFSRHDHRAAHRSGRVNVSYLLHAV